MADEDLAIRFDSQVFKFQTLIDGGWRLTLDGQGNPDAVMKLINAKQPGIILKVVAVAIQSDE